MSRFLRRVRGLLVVMALALGVTIVSAPAASAAPYGWVYISAPTWQGNCSAGGSVVNMNAAVGNTWSGGDAGDDLLYVRVRLNENQQVSYSAFCNKWPVGYWQPGVAQTIKPTRNNQTVWVGPLGVRYN
jgi:hypothetical protein